MLVSLWVAGARLEAAFGPAPAPEESKPAEEWAVKLAPGSAPGEVARAAGASSWRELRGLPGFYVFSFAPGAEDGGAVLRQRQARVEAQPQIEWEERQVGRRRDLRAAPTTEPLFAAQWHLENQGQTGGLAQVDLQVRPVWEAGITGAGVGVSVLDTGTEYTHPDLIARFRQGWDAVGDDTSPLPDPSTWPNTDAEDHGTAVSGIILASVNDLGGSGIAPGADLYPVRIPLGENSRLTDVAEVEALSHLLETIWVSNNSWGPSDREGASLARPGSLVRSLFAEATANGRGGRGTIYVWAGGNGRDLGQRSNYDGYADSRHTIAVGAMGQDGQASSFTEPGANILVAAPSLGAGRGIMTTDRLGSAGYASGEYERSFSGTSAAAPMVAGVVALMLEAQPDLGWRDVQHILARTAVRTDFDDAGWFPNGAGFALHDDLGFGRVNALGAVRLAQQWTPVGPSVTRTVSSLQNATIPDGGNPLVRTGTIASPVRVEHVELVLSLNHSQ